MFERSLLEAQPTPRWTAIVSITLQCALAAAMIAVPLLHRATLDFRSVAPKLFLPLKPAPVLPPRVIAATTGAMATAAAAPTPPAPAPAPAGRPLTLITHAGPATTDAPPSLNPMGRMGTGDPASIGFGVGPGDHPGPSIAVTAARPADPIRVSSGIISGLLLLPIKPDYPRMAIATRTKGTVVVEAIISKSGGIESARATAGPAMLREAALDAIRRARYSPYLLNGTPTEVLTTITVQFRLGN